MRAFQITGFHDVQPDHAPLQEVETRKPLAGENEVLIEVEYCGVCHTELDEIEGRAKPDSLPRIPGHQVVGAISECGEGVEPTFKGKRVGVAWISSSCQACDYCRQGLENLCPEYRATGKDVDGGYAEYMTIGADYVIEIPENLASEEAAPLLCAGAIAYRSLALCELREGQALGLTGFGSSGKVALQLAKLLYPSSPVYVFARSDEERAIALANGATWAGHTNDAPDRKLDAVIDTTPVWTPIIKALESLAPNGKVIVNAISKLSSDQDALLDLDFNKHLWLERSIKSVANVSRKDVHECLRLISESDWRPAVDLYDFSQANQALIDLKTKPVKAAKVLVVKPG